MKGPARRRGPGARLSGRRLAGRLFLAAREAAASLLKKARYPDALPGIPLLLPLGRRPAQARVKSSTLRAEVNAFNPCDLRSGSGLEKCESGCPCRGGSGSDPDFLIGREEVR